MPPKRRTPGNHDQEMSGISDDLVQLKRAQVAAWRQASDPVPCDHEAPLMLAWFRNSAMIGEAYRLDDSSMAKRGELYRSSGTVDSYAIFCPECDLWLAIGEKNGG
jgi:hypothetical protein